MTNKTFSSLKIVTLAVVLSFGLSYVYAWTAPTQNPPAGNVSAPINTSATAQTKAGDLTVNTITSGDTSGGDFISKVATIYNGTIGGKISFFNTDNVTNTAAIAEIRTINVSNNTPPTIQSHNSGGKLSFATKGAFSTLDERMIIGADGKVGIGVPVPAQLLDVGGIIKATGLQVTTGATLGKVLTSDASGNATWQNASSVGVNASLGAAYWYHPGCGYGGPCSCPDNSIMVGTYGWWTTYTDAYYLCRNILN